MSEPPARPPPSLPASRRAQIVNLQSTSQFAIGVACPPPCTINEPPPRPPPSRTQIVNLQSTSQFASHQMNRDTWRNEMVRALVENNFVLFQVRRACG